MRRSPVLVVAALLLVWHFATLGRADDPPAPVKMTAQEDHKRLMELLKIKELRRGADGNPKSANAANPLITVDIQLTLTTPEKTTGPVPVMMEFGFNFGGKGPAPKAGAAPSWQQQVLDKGWGYAIITPTSVQADNGAGLTAGIIGLC